MCQLSVYNQVSIASDGGGEVSVEGNIEGIMTAISPGWHLCREVTSQLRKLNNFHINCSPHKNNQHNCTSSLRIKGNTATVVFKNWFNISEHCSHIR